MKKEIENQKSYIGIDVSKLTIDVCIITAQGEQDYQQFENTAKDFKNMELWLNKKSYFCYQEALFCMEHTGLYTRELVSFLLQRESKVWMESALHLKRSMGMTRGKNDKVDSYRIARYAMTNNDKAVLLKLSSGTLLKLKDLMANRERLSKNYQSLKIATQELVRVDKSIGKELMKLNDAALKGILKSKVKVEKRMLQLINEDEELKTLFSLITSVKCVGDVLATELIVYTNGFTRMNNTRQLACYCGIAPFEHSSGTSVRGRIGTSNFANMKLKSTLHMAAVSATRYVPDIKLYYERKVGEGKHKMAVINAIRNKLIQRIMAIVKRGTPYQENYSKFNLDLS
ncbi:MAG: IS110 family transposase [Bacteroidia bacterium]|jgi:transposase|nr:IS110 family transposase [Bacteroidia bacterium]